VTAARILAAWAGARPGTAALLLSADGELLAGFVEATGAPPAVVPADAAAHLAALAPGSVDLAWLDLGAACPDVAARLRDCARVTRPGGRLVVRALDGAGRPPGETAGALADALAVLGLADVCGRVMLSPVADASGAAAPVARALRRGLPGVRLVAVAAAAVARGTVPP
jgi:SAM-dependent methyltransferase